MFNYQKAETAIDRVKFGSDIIDADVYINVQGDEPIVNVDDIKKYSNTQNYIQKELYLERPKQQKMIFLTTQRQR